jgi:hypothetical protein
MNAFSASGLDTCGCCQENIPQPVIYNRPGMPALNYRIGTYSTFLRRMLAHLASQTIPPNEPDGTRPFLSFTTRALDDPAIALLDAWATVADVLTFYQERIANEGYLRTATERLSVLELARTVGYELSPGVAAETFLAFTVEDASGAPGIATVPRGTKVTSIPVQEQLPQTFETGAGITARAEWNSLHPRLFRPQELAISNNRLYLLGISTGFSADTPEIPVEDVYPLDPTMSLPSGKVQTIEVKQIYFTGMSTDLKEGDLLLFAGTNPDNQVKTLILPVKSVTVKTELTQIQVELGEEIKIEPQEEPKTKPPRITFKAIFLKPGTIRLSALPFEKNYVENMVTKRTWRERDITAFLSIQGWSGRDLVRNIKTSQNIKLPPSDTGVSSRNLVRSIKTSQNIKLPPPDTGVFNFRVRTSPFGNNAPRWDSLPLNQRYEDENKGKPVPYPEPGWDSEEPDITLGPVNGSYIDKYGVDFFLERTFPEITKGSWLLLETNLIPEKDSIPEKNLIPKLYPYRVAMTAETSLADFSLNAKTTGVKVEKVPDSADLTIFKVRSTTVHAASKLQELADLPIEEALAKDSISIQLDGMVLGLQVGQPLILNGERDDLIGVTNSEVLILSDILHSDGFTTLFFKDPLKHSYVRKTVTINANIVISTHGEIVNEVLGSGNGAQPNQQFTLKKPPLTYISASTAKGSQSTLQVKVNGIKWQEVQSLFGLDTHSEGYIVRIEDDGNVRVIFGDGNMGARLPSGAENVSATYRSGIGLSGMLEADRLTQLKTRPLGIRSVTNPLPTNGAAEPESRDSARVNASLTTLTLDRIVSLKDFENFARGFAGTGKAQAIALRKGGTELVHITIAAAASHNKDDSSTLATNVVDSESSLFKNLVEAIKKASDPAQKFLIDSYQMLFFNVKAKVLVDPRYIIPDVLAAVETMLIDTFSFEKRNFGQAVTEAEVVTVAQSVPGVIAIDLDQLYRYQDGESPPDPDEQIVPEVLDANSACWNKKDNTIQPAQLLLINPVGINLEEMKP